MKEEYKEYLIKDIDFRIYVELRDKDCLLEMIDDYVLHLSRNRSSGINDTFTILYKDGSYDVINDDYNGHKIRKQGIVSVVNVNPFNFIVYGCYCIDEYGNVDVSDKMAIDKNIKELK